MILNLIQFQASHFDLKSVGSSLTRQLSMERLKVRRVGDNIDNNQTFCLLVAHLYKAFIQKMFSV